MNKDFVELFSGIGGMSHGLVKAGWNCVGYVEMDKYAHQSYEILHDPDKKLWSGYDVRNVTDDDIRFFGTERGGVLPLLAGGFPCQSFSIAGKRAGFADVTRGTLFFEIIRFALILRPKYLLLENVDGLRNHDKGKTFETILGALDEVGYDVEWQMHNSVAYVPQNRERIFIIGHLRGSSTRKVFPFGRENSKSIKVVGKLECYNDQNNRVYGIGGVSPTLPTMQGGGQEPKVLIPNKPTEFSFKGTGIAYCLDTGYAKGISPNEVGKARRTQVISIDMKTETSKTRGGMFKEERTGALDHNCNIAATRGFRIRRLTPLECFRLQSYPDIWYVTLKLFRHPEYIPLIDMNRDDITAQVLTIIKENGLKEGIFDSQLYKMAGNGVTSDVAEDIGKRLLDIMINGR